MELLCNPATQKQRDRQYHKVLGIVDAIGCQELQKAYKTLIQSAV